MTYEAWRISYQSSEQAARAAYAECARLQAKIAEMERQEPAGWQRLYEDGSSTEDIVDSPNVFAHQRPLYALPGAQPAPSVPLEAIEKMLTQLMDIAVSNGANSVSMPDEYVEVAAWLCGIPAQPASGVPEGWLRAIDEALVIAHIGVANAHDTYEQAKAKLDSLIGLHVDIATDPAVNGGWKLMPIDPTRSMLDRMDLGSNMLYRYRALLAASPDYVREVQRQEGPGDKP